METANVSLAGDGGKNSIVQLSAGVWAGEKLLGAMRAGKGLTSSALRTSDALRKDEWQFLDDVVVDEGLRRLRAIQDLMDAGLTTPLPNALGTTEFQFEKVTDLSDAEVSLSGVARSVLDRQDYTRATVPVPIVHKDFNLFLRTLEASRMRGEALDMTQPRNASRRVSEKLEDILFNGGPAFGGNTLAGYTTHANRNTAGFGTNGAWDQAAKTGENILDDVLTMRDGLSQDRYFGPYFLYVPKNFEKKLMADFKANSDKSTKQRIIEVDGLRPQDHGGRPDGGFRFVDQLANSNVVMVNATSDVVVLADGQMPVPVQWELAGGFQINFKVWAIEVPIIKSDAAGRSGIFHMS